MRTGKDKRGFTIVELLVVIAAIAILLGLLLVGVQSASRMTRNIRSMSRLKQVHIAWTTYANAYDDRLLPGYLDAGVQENWRVRYQGPDGKRLNAGICATYPWRLLPYLDFDLDPMYGYRGDLQAIENNFGNPDAPDHDAAQATIAATPAFGYNAYYVGGWWEEREDRSHLIFGNSAADIQIGDNVVSVKGRLVATSMGRIVQPERQIAFCTSTFRSPGQYVVQEDNPDGAAWAVPQRLAQTQIWRPFMGDVQAGLTASIVPLQSAGDGIDVLVAQAVPLRRHGITVPILNCDGSTEQATIDELMKMDRWIPAALDASGNPTLFEHAPDP